MPRRSNRRIRRHPRAVAVAFAGAAGLIAAGGFGTPALRPIGAGLLVLGVGAIILVEASADGLRLRRLVDRDTIRADERIAVTLQLSGWPARTGLVRFLDWELRSGLPVGGSAERRKRRRIRDGIAEEIGVTGLPRGIHTLGPPSVALADPFGLARLRRASTATDEILVLPITVPVAIPFWESGAARRAGQTAGLLRGRAELGGVRDYEPGDPLSLIHWGQTARRGTLQTKELHGEAGRGAALLVLLDASTAAGEGGHPDRPFEVAVSAAASLVACCVARGDAVGLEHTGRTPALLPIGSPAGPLQQALATVQPDGPPGLASAIRGIASRAHTPRQLVVVTAAADRGLAGAAQQARSTGIALAVVSIGPARATSGELRRAGAWVVDVTGRADLAAALNAGGRGAVAV
jgi:uncharacterized protein (DUF58 family)